MAMDFLGSDFIQSTQRTITVAMGPPFGSTDLSAGFTIKISKAGGALSTITPTTTFVAGSNGMYAITLTTSHTDTLGTNVVWVASTGQDDYFFAFSVVGTTSAPTAAQVATAVWQDTTAGDFTVAGSIGKSLFTSGNVPGAANGLQIAGSNAATTYATLTSTGAFTVNGVSSVSQTGDSFARIGAAGVGLTAVGLTGTQAFNNTGTWTGNIVGTLSTLTTYTGNTPQTGDAYARLGAPVGASISADIAAIPAAVWAVVLDGTNTAIKLARGWTAALLGKASGLDSNAPKYRNIADTKDVISATTDASGDRTAVTLDLT